LEFKYLRTRRPEEIKTKFEFKTFLPLVKFHSIYKKESLNQKLHRKGYNGLQNCYIFQIYLFILPKKIIYLKGLHPDGGFGKVPLEKIGTTKPHREDLSKAANHMRRRLCRCDASLIA